MPISDEDRRKLVALVDRRAFPCTWCDRRVFAALDQNGNWMRFDARPHGKGTHVLVPMGKVAYFRVLELASLKTPREWGATRGHDTYVIHKRTCGGLWVKPWWGPTLRKLLEEHRFPPLAPLEKTHAELIEGDIVLSMVPDEALPSPPRTPATVNALGEDWLRLGTQELPSGPTARFRVVRRDLPTEPIDALMLATSWAAVRTGGCSCLPAPVVDREHGHVPRCVLCGRRAASRRPRPRPLHPNDPKHIFEEVWRAEEERQGPWPFEAPKKGRWGAMAEPWED